MSKLAIHTDGHLGGYVQGGDPGTWCPRLWTWAVEEFGIRAVLDVGCGEGHSTRFFHELGCRVLGVDGCTQAIEDGVIPEHMVRHDFRDGPFLPRQPFDLVWSCEFVEHVEEEFLPNVLTTFAQARKMILLTHAFPRQRKRGHHHVNCRRSPYWIKRIEKLGFECDVELSREARTVTLGDYPGINHFARSGLVFVRCDADTSGFWRRWAKAWKIRFGFRTSAAYRHHRKCLAASRREARALRFPAGSG